MAARMKAADFLRDADLRQQVRADRVIAAASGSLSAIAGGIVAVRGALDPSVSPTIPILTGASLIVAGALVVHRRAAGVWIFAALFVCTMAWSLLGPQLASQPLGFRLAGPAALLVVLALVAPPLLGWRTRRTQRGLIILAMGAAAISAFSIAAVNASTPADIRTKETTS